MSSRRAAQGFTMVELIVVIVILGILGATALPRFVDITSDAKESAYQGVRAAAASAMVVNYSGCVVNNHGAATGKCVRVRACTDVASLLQGQALPTGYTVAASGAEPAAIGTEATCVLSYAPGGTAYTPGGSTSFTGIGAGN